MRGAFFLGCLGGLATTVLVSVYLQAGDLSSPTGRAPPPRPSTSEKDRSVSEEHHGRLEAAYFAFAELADSAFAAHHEHERRDAERASRSASVESEEKGEELAALPPSSAVVVAPAPTFAGPRSWQKWHEMGRGGVESNTVESGNFLPAFIRRQVSV